MNLDTLFDFLVDYKLNNNGNSPSYQDICDFFMMEKGSTVVRYLLLLETQGRISLNRDEFGKAIPRSINIPGYTFTKIEYVLSTESYDEPDYAITG